MCSTIFAVKWIYFNGNVKDGNAVLNWRMDNDADIQKFIIESSADGSNFKPVGTEDISQNNIQSRVHSFTDYNFSDCKTPAIFYRITAINNTGAGLISTVISLKGIKTVSGNVNAYPNPFTEQVSVNVGTGENIIRTELYNVSGKLIRSSKGNGSFGKLNDLGNLPAGTYLVKTITGSGAYFSKMVKN